MNPAGRGEVRVRTWPENKETHISLRCLFPKVLETSFRELNRKQEQQLQIRQLLMAESTSV